MLFSSTGCVVMKTLKDEWQCVIMACKLAVLEIFCISMYRMSAPTLHNIIESTDSDTVGTLTMQAL